jgi:hypothetical protein
MITSRDTTDMITSRDTTDMITSRDTTDMITSRDTTAREGVIANGRRSMTIASTA